MQVQLINNIHAVITNIVGKVCAFEVKVTSFNIKNRVDDYGVAKLTECQINPNTGNVEAEPSTSSAKKRKMT